MSGEPGSVRRFLRGPTGGARGLRAGQKGGHETEEAPRPSQGADPVRVNEPGVDCRIESSGELMVERDLEQRRGNPDQSEKTEAQEKRRGTLTVQPKPSPGSQFKEHQRPHEGGDVPGMSQVIRAETLRSDVRHEGIMEELDGPDQSAQDARHGKVPNQQCRHGEPRGVHEPDWIPVVFKERTR